MNPQKIADAFATWLADEGIDAVGVLSAFTPCDLPADGYVMVSVALDNPYKRNTFGGFRADVSFRLDMPFSGNATAVGEFYEFFEAILGSPSDARAEMNIYFADVMRGLYVAEFALSAMPEPTVTELGFTYEVVLTVLGQLSAGNGNEAES